MNLKKVILANKNIVLIEHGYKNKYPVLGLMKIAIYYNQYGKKDYIKFIKRTEDKSLFDVNYYCIYLTTLFLFECKEISGTIEVANKKAK